VHLEDVAGALLHSLDDDRARGPVDVTAPAPMTGAELEKALGRSVGAR
jgi:NAD dependent epimerase/dehydratase family enzyme